MSGAVSYTHLDVYKRQGLIHALLSAEYSSATSNLMSCLARQGDDKAMETLLELERNPRPWRKGLYVDPSSYAQIGGLSLIHILLREKRYNRPAPLYGISSSRNCLPISLPPRRNRDRRDNHGKA